MPKTGKPANPVLGIYIPLGILEPLQAAVKKHQKHCEV